MMLDKLTADDPSSFYLTVIQAFAIEAIAYVYMISLLKLVISIAMLTYQMVMSCVCSGVFQHNY